MGAARRTGMCAVALAACWTAYAQTGAQVVRQVPVRAAEGSKLTIREGGGARRLYIQHAAETRIDVLDIARPETARLLRPVELSAGASAIQFHGTLALVTEPAADEANSADRATVAPQRPGTVTIWDVSDPSSPARVRRFENVLSILPDSGGYVYLLQPDTLSVLYGGKPRPAIDWSLYAGGS